jgi:GTP cyclohydrolase IB
MDSCVRMLPDYAEGPSGEMPLEKVGIKGFKQFMRDFSSRRTLTSQSAYVDLVNRNGVHMSRLVAALNDYEDDPITMNSELLETLAEGHSTTNSYWECNWTAAHEMENEQLIYIETMLEGVLVPDKEDWYLTLKIPYASVCPCAMAMVTQEGGVPHMQRAVAQITGLLTPREDLDDLMTSIVARVVDAVDIVPIPYMKRPDELNWCQRASKTNLFVEDASRVIGATIDGWLEDWVVVCTHQESIHQHDVVSVCRKGKKLM